MTWQLESGETDCLVGNSLALLASAAWKLAIVHVVPLSLSQ